METNLVKINEEINKELSNTSVATALLATTFKGLAPVVMKKAIFEGMMRGFTFKDFLEKNVYAIPFRDGYSLITSIDYARKIAMRSGLAGKSEPVYKENESGEIVSCSVTIKRNVDGVVGEYTATVYFKEYTTGRNLWVSKPRTMIAKVAEMHALRSAFPEEMSKQYVEEEIENEMPAKAEINIGEYEAKLRECKNAEELKKVWVSIPAQAKVALENVKNELKTQYDSPKV